MKRLKMSSHFQERMIERAINLEHVKQAINTPEKEGNAPAGRKWVMKKIGQKTIKVIYYKEGFKDKKNEYLLVTAYYI